MRAKPIITLLTDFGLDDEYVGVMKGVILSIHSEAVVVDITHHIRPHDIRHAALILRSAYPYFPPGSIHVSVVDPGVGGNRDILCAKHHGHYFIAPNNGLLTLVLEDSRPDNVVAVKNRRWFLESMSDTFHGRDIFAPVAAHVLKGTDISELGPPLQESQITFFTQPRPTIAPGGRLTGEIIAMDRFGNIVTNIDRPTFCSVFSDGRRPPVVITLAGRSIHGISPSYGAVSKGEPLAIFGSRNLLEVSVNQGNAQTVFSAQIGQPVTVGFFPGPEQLPIGRVPSP